MLFGSLMKGPSSSGLAAHQEAFEAPGGISFGLGGLRCGFGIWGLGIWGLGV